MSQANCYESPRGSTDRNLNSHDADLEKDLKMAITLMDAGIDEDVLEGMS